MKIGLQLLTSLLTMLSVDMAGRGDQRFNFVGLFNQLLWVLVIVSTGAYGILVLTFGMTFVYSRNIYRNRTRREHELD